MLADVKRGTDPLTPRPELVTQIQEGIVLQAQRPPVPQASLTPRSGPGFWLPVLGIGTVLIALAIAFVVWRLRPAAEPAGGEPATAIEPDQLSRWGRGT